VKSPWRLLKDSHRQLKRTMGRGSPVAHALAAELYLRRLEAECDRARALLVMARLDGDVAKMDEAQQRLHRVINEQAQRA